MGSLRVMGNFLEEKDWLVERGILSNDCDQFFVTPNVLINSRNPVLPMANTSSYPRRVRKGEILGYLVDPEEGLEKQDPKPAP